MLELRQAQYRRGSWQLSVEHLVVPPSSLVAITGDNGSGKTTLLRVMSLLLSPEQGGVRYLDQAIRGAAAIRAFQREVILVHQNPYLFDGDVFDNVMFGLRVRGVEPRAAAHTVRETLALLGVEHLLKRGARRISGGEAQRVAIARALVLQPKVLLLDEPFAAADEAGASRIVELVRRRAWSSQASVVIASHSQWRRELDADATYEVRDGQVCEVVGPRVSLRN